VAVEERAKVLFRNRNGVIVEVDKLKRIPLFEDMVEGEFIVGEQTYRLNFREIAENEGNKDYFEKSDGLRLFRQLMEEEDISFEETQEKLGEVKFEFTDITDLQFNQFQEIPQSVLSTQGLWAGNGIRKIKLKVEGVKGEISSAYFYKMDNREIEPLFLEVKEEEVNEEKVKVAILDTDKIGEILGDNPTGNFYGIVELPKKRWKFLFPVDIKFLNPELAPRVWQRNESVAIDFGTSSTCVAVNRGKDLIPFTDHPKGDEDYENATALIIFNWKEVFKNWSGEKTPHFNRSREGVEKEEEEDASNVDYHKYHYNYSSYVKRQLKKNPEGKVIEAIITKIKLLPQHIENHPNDRLSFKPFDPFRSLVYLTDQVEEENDETLNPIALYGYLISRALNKQINNKVYTRYILTMPVNFNERQKQRIQDSLEYGIKKGIPQALRDKVEVKFKIEEPVALLGALKRIGKLKIPKGKKALPFAIFDFGGGTLDFAFGIYRKPARNKELQVLEKENRYSSVVEIFRTDGKNIGGETLIEALSYKIYKDNSSQMEQLNIPIKVPEGEKPIFNFNQRLLVTTHISYINLQKLSEVVSREIFMTPQISEDGRLPEVINYIIDTGSFEIELLDENGFWKKVLLQLNIDDALEFLEERFKKEVRNFKSLLQTTFGNFQERLEKFGFDEFGIGDIQIFLSGNTTKSPLLIPAFQKVFCEEDHVIDWNELEPNLIWVQDPEKRVTVKNAVARGALFLSTMGVYNHTLGFGGKMPLDRYIWNIEMLEEGDITPVFMAGDNDQKDFEVISRFIDPDEVEIFYSKGMVEDIDDSQLKRVIISIPERFRNEDYYYLCAKPYNGSVIEVALGDDDGRDSATFFVDLNSGEVKEEL
jgi:hypothetical protein